MKGGKFVPPTIQTSVNFRDFEGLSVLASFQQMTLYSNLAVLKLKGAFSSGGRDGSSLTCPCQKVEKIRGKVYCMTNRMKNRPQERFRTIKVTCLHYSTSLIDVPFSK